MVQLRASDAYLAIKQWMTALWHMLRANNNQVVRYASSGIHPGSIWTGKRLLHLSILQTANRRQHRREVACGLAAGAWQGAWRAPGDRLQYDQQNAFRSEPPHKSWLFANG